MKFSLLQIGQRFEYRGKRYIKTTPLVAMLIDAEPGDSEQQKLIPRSAEVRVLSEHKPEKPATAPPLEAKNVRAAFDRFNNGLDRLVNELETKLDEQSRALLQTELKQQRQNFLQALGLD